PPRFPLFPYTTLFRSSASDCAQSEQCQGAEGCGGSWTCAPAKPCTRDLVAFCGCDGKSFFGSSTCPGKPYARRGACAGDAFGPRSEEHTSELQSPTNL